MYLPSAETIIAILRLIITTYAIFFVINYTGAQQSLGYYLDYKFNDFYRTGSKRYMETGLAGGINFRDRFQFGIGLTYNFTRSYDFKKVLGQENLRYLNVGGEASYILLIKHRIKPLLKLSIGTGIPAKKNDSIALDDEGTPYILDKNLLNWENYFHGYFIRNSIQSSLALFVDISITKNLVLELGGGYQYRLIKKTTNFYFPEKYIHQHGWTLNLGVKYVFGNKM